MAWTHYTDRAVLDEDAEILGSLRLRRGITFGPESYTFDPLFYGALGNNVNDDAPAIQRAIDAAVSRGRGRILLTPTLNGYRLDSPLRIPINAVDLTIDGPGALLNPNHNFDCISIGDLTTQNNRAENIVLRGFTINGPGSTSSTNTSQNGIGIYSVLGCHMEDVKIYNIPQHAIFAQKSAQSGSQFMNQILLNRCLLRFVGKRGLSFCESGAAGDDLTVVATMFNNLGKAVSTGATGADAGVNINATTVAIFWSEFSLIRNNNNSNGYYRGVYMRNATGSMIGAHFEDNCNNQADSVDIFLDTDCHGFVIVGSDHFCNTTTSSQYGIKTTSKDNIFTGIRHNGGGTGRMLYLIDVTGATNPCVINPTDGGTPPITGVVKYTTEKLFGHIGGVAIADALTLKSTKVLTGSGSPETVVTAPVGSIYLRTDGGASTSFYVKESGSGNTGWIAK